MKSSLQDLSAFSLDQSASETPYSIPSFPSPTFNWHPTGIRYMHDLGNFLPCWGKCQLRYWIYKRQNPNTKLLATKSNPFSHPLPKPFNHLLEWYQLSSQVHQNEAQNTHKPIKSTRRGVFVDSLKSPHPLHSLRQWLPLFRKQSFFSIQLSIKKLEFYFSLASNLCFGQSHKIPQ